VKLRQQTFAVCFPEFTTMALISGISRQMDCWNHFPALPAAIADKPRGEAARAAALPA
jgi:hypothetical protein